MLSNEMNLVNIHRQFLTKGQKWFIHIERNLIFYSHLPWFLCYFEIFIQAQSNTICISFIASQLWSWDTGCSYSMTHNWSQFPIDRIARVYSHLMIILVNVNLSPSNNWLCIKISGMEVKSVWTWDVFNLLWHAVSWWYYNKWFTHFFYILIVI